MKKLLLIIACVFSITALSAQSNKEYYVYGVDFTQSKVYAAAESVEQFSQAFQSINLLLATEAGKYDFSLMLGRSSILALDPMMKLLSACDYANLKVYQKEFPDIDYAACIKNYDLPQEEGIGVVLIAKLLDKPGACAYYNLVQFDIATREIISQQDVVGQARGFGLRNFWAGSIYQILSSVKAYCTIIL